MTKHFEYTVNDTHRDREYVLASNQDEALKLIFAKHQGARIYPVSGRWGVEAQNVS